MAGRTAAWKAGALVAFAALMLGVSLTRATTVDATEPLTIVVGPSPGASPMARVDGARRGRARQPLPDRPKVLWRRPGRGALDLASLVVDARGALILPSANVPELAEIGADGKERWRAETGLGPSVAGALILNDGTRLVVTSAGEAVGFASNGDRRFATTLDLSERNARVTLLPLEDGGTAIGSAHDIVELDGDGRARGRTHLAERTTGPLVATGFGVIATAASGNVYLVRPGYAKRLGSLGGDPGDAGASSPDGRSLAAVVDHQRVVALDLGTGVIDVKLTVGDQSLHGPVLVGRAGTLLLTTWTGVLTTIAPTREVRRTPLELRLDSLVTDAGKIDFAALEESPAPVTDEEGRIAFARVGGRVGVVSRAGAVALLSGPTCASPAAIAPAGERRFAVACRDGSILMMGESAP
jgi:hypothetical protein